MIYDLFRSLGFTFYQKPIYNWFLVRHKQKISSDRIIMCGIFCEICYSNNTLIKDDQILQRIKNRGPNCVQSTEITLNESVTAFFCGAVLWMQGPTITPQPVENDQGILLYNGDIFDETWDTHLSDTQLIMEKLYNRTDCSSEDHIIKQMRLLKGPFCIIYYDKLNNNLYFTRDRIGRSSLVIHRNNKSTVISNVLGRNYECVEIPAMHIHVLNLGTSTIKLYSWNDKLEPEQEVTLDVWLETLQIQQNLPDEEFKFDYNEEDFNHEEEVVTYMESVARSTNCKLTVIDKLMEHATIRKAVLKVTELLEKSVEIRLKRQPNMCKECLNNGTGHCCHCTVGILFSGGLDCTILALLANKYLPEDQSIDLINVAFKKDENGTYDVPDRLTGRQSLEELRRLCPSRKWTFREVNVPKEELEKNQMTIIADLVYPRQTILDESLGSVLWFAARGQDDQDVSTCRVLLIGSGADELFGGYIRHRNAFKRFGWTGLSKELQLDWKRISFRNLARDNRVICDHGRQPRMPYLDEDFTTFVLQLRPWLRCFPCESLGVGIGDKLMLRLVASNLGLTDAVVLPKRAMQFGSRIANKKERGNDVSKTFWNGK